MKKLLTFYNSTTVVGKGAILSLSTILAVLINMKAALLGLCILILFDLLTGIRANLHRRRISCNPLKAGFWKSIKSYLLRRTWKKTYEYGIGILVIATFETFIFGSPMSIILMEKSFTLAEIATLVPALVEVWSIFENLEKVSKRNFLKKLITLMPARFQRLLTDDVVIDKIEEELPAKDVEVIKDVIEDLER